MYCCRDKSLARRSLEVLRSLIGNAARAKLPENCNLVEALLTLALSEPVEECLQVVRALHAVKEHQPLALKTHSHGRVLGAPLVQELEEALRQGYIPRRRPLGWRTLYEGELDSVQVATELLTALKM
jgi:hypothetical protein